MSKLKKVFGEQSDETLTLMKVLGDNYILMGKYSDAQKIFNERLNVCKKNFGERDVRTVESTIKLAHILYKTGKYVSADNSLADIINNSQDILNANPQLLYDFCLIKSEGAYMQGAYNEYVRFWSALFEVEEKLPYSELRYLNGDSTILDLLSKLDLVWSNPKPSITTLNLLKHLVKQYNPKVLVRLNEIAEFQIRFGELKQSESFAQQIFELSRKSLGKDNLYEWMALKTLGKIRRLEGNFSDALTIDKKALQIAEKVCGKNSLERLQTLDCIAQDYTGKGSFTEAIKIRENALKEYKKICEIEDVATLQMMTNLADNYVSVKRYDEALKLCDEAISKQKVPVYSNGHLSGFPGISELFHVKALAQKLSGDNVNSAETYKQLINLYEWKRGSFSTGVEMEELLNDRKMTSAWFARLIPDYKAAAEISVSDKVNDKNFAFYSSEFCKGRNLIDHYNNMFVSKNYLFDENEKGVLHYFQKLLASGKDIVEYAKTTGNSEYAEFVNLWVELAYADYKNKLSKKYSIDETLLENPLKDFDITKNQKAIPNNACLVEFLKVSDESLLVLFLHNSGDVDAENIAVDKEFFDKCYLYHELNSYADINALNSDGKYLWQIDKDEYQITTTRSAPVESAISVKDNSKWNELRQQLSADISQKLIPPIEKYVGNSTHWIISPDTELNLIPFETLIYHDNPVIKSVDVSYVPSLAVLNLMKQREIQNDELGQRKELFAMGDAIYGNNDVSTSRGSQLNFFNHLRNSADDEIDITKLKWNNLPGTAREMDKVAALFESKDIFRKDEVTEKNLQQLSINGELSKYKYLLFATHGLFVPDKPELSSIVLNQQFNDNETDGYVTVSEWMGYKLNSNLVYLSACESGLGGYQAGEGIVGIPYALTIAGNKDTVMSLWKVDDEASAEFSSTFFQKLSQGKSEVIALNETKREFISTNDPKYSDPSIWAAFLLYGI